MLSDHKISSFLDYVSFDFFILLTLEQMNKLVSALLKTWEATKTFVINHFNWAHYWIRCKYWVINIHFETVLILGADRWRGWMVPLIGFNVDNSISNRTKTHFSFQDRLRCGFSLFADDINGWTFETKHLIAFYIWTNRVHFKIERIAFNVELQFALFHRKVARCLVVCIEKHCISNEFAFNVNLLLMRLSDVCSAVGSNTNSQNRCKPTHSKLTKELIKLFNGHKGFGIV